MSKNALLILFTLLLLAGCNDFNGRLLEDASLPEPGIGEGTYDNLPRDANPQLAEYKLRNRWQKNELTYYIHSYSSDLPSSTQSQIFAEALNTWAAVTNLSFSEVSSAAQADMVIGFGRQAHCELYQLIGTACDTDPNIAFDGPGQVLAHCYFPGYGTISGDAHFDEDETYVQGYSSGNTVDLLSVAVHEFGHGLGLEHSDDRNAIMYYRYNPDRTNAALGQDDIQGIQELYGASGGTPPPPPAPPSNPAPPSSSCGNPTAYDSDGDGIDNYTELYLIGTNPQDCDTDRDGLPDIEVYYGLNPLNPDTDGDGISDGQEVAQGTNPLIPNTSTPGGGGGATIAGNYSGQDSFGSPLSFTVYPDGSAQGVLRILYFGRPTDIYLVGGITNAGLLQLVSYDYYFSFIGQFGGGGAQGNFQTLDGAFGTWSTVKTGRVIPVPDSELISSVHYQPAGAPALENPHAVHQRVNWRAQ